MNPNRGHILTQCDVLGTGNWPARLLTHFESRTRSTPTVEHSARSPRPPMIATSTPRSRKDRSGLRSGLATSSVRRPTRTDRNHPRRLTRGLRFWAVWAAADPHTAVVWSRRLRIAGLRDRLSQRRRAVAPESVACPLAIPVRCRAPQSVSSILNGQLRFGPHRAWSLKVAEHSGGGRDQGP